MPSGSQYRVEDLLEDCAGKLNEAHPQWRVGADVLAIVWDHLCAFIETQMLTGKGVNVPNFGVFTFSVENINLGNREKSSKTPVFVVNEMFARTQDKRTPAKNIPVIQINNAQIALESNTNRDIVVEFLKHVFRILGATVKTAKTSFSSVYVALGLWAVLTSSTPGVVRVQFTNDFVSSASQPGSSSGLRTRTMSQTLSDSDPQAFSRSIHRSATRPETPPHSHQPPLENGVGANLTDSPVFSRSISAPRGGGRKVATPPAADVRRSFDVDLLVIPSCATTPDIVKRASSSLLQVDGVSVPRTDLSPSERPQNPARKTRSPSATSSAAESPLPSIRGSRSDDRSGSAKSTSSMSEQDLCDLCKYASAQLIARAREGELQKQKDRMYVEREKANRKALEDREEREKHSKRLALLDAQRVNNEMLQKKIERLQMDKHSDFHGALLQDRPPHTPPEVKKAAYREALKDQMSEKLRAVEQQRAAEVRERESNSRERKAHEEEQNQRFQKTKARQEDYARYLSEQAEAKKAHSHSVYNVSELHLKGSNGTSNARAFADDNVMQRNSRPKTQEEKSKRRAQATTVTENYREVIELKKQKELEQKARQADELRVWAQNVAEENRNHELMAVNKKNEVRLSLQKAWAEQRERKQDIHTDHLSPSHTSIHMGQLNEAELLEHLKHCKKCGRNIPQKYHGRSSGDFRKVLNVV